MVQTKSKLANLEALRGLLALWVLVTHVTVRIISSETIGAAHFRGPMEPLIPVYVFMILSGFVIFTLLRRERVPYGAFLLRRLFRLAPLYLAVLVVSSTLVGFELHTLEHLFWRNAHVYDAIKIHRETLDHFWEHFTAHALLLHGLISDGWLKDANFTFLSQSWSISLEWQFYLMAPGVFFLITRQHYFGLGLLAVGLAAICVLNYASVGFLPNQFFYFTLGIASCYAYTHCGWFTHIGTRAHDAVILALAAALYFMLKQPLPILIWLFVMDAMMAKRAGMHTRMTGALSWLLERPILQWLGEISYSVYLVHIPILYMVFAAITHLSPHIGGWRFLALALPATIAATLAVATASYRWIEQPGIALGHILARRLSTPTLPSPDTGARVTP